MKKKVILIIAVILLAGLVLLAFFSNSAGAPGKKTNEQQSETQSSNQTASPQTATPAFNKSLYSTTDPTSKWVIVNKVSALPSSYVPADLTATYQGEVMRTEAATALSKLLASAKAAGSDMYAISGYRSYATQVATYNNYVKTDGQAKADTYSARPGHSEHQSGWAIDLGNSVCDLNICFGNTPTGKWLAAHAHEYGFIIRYPAGKEALTGYQYEPWHIRYVGAELATELSKTGQTMEEFFGVVPNPQPY